MLYSCYNTGNHALTESDMNVHPPVFWHAYQANNYARDIVNIDSKVGESIMLRYCSDATSQSSVSASTTPQRVAENTHDKLCKCSKFSNLSSLVSITHLGICSSAS